MTVCVAAEIVAVADAACADRESCSFCAGSVESRRSVARHVRDGRAIRQVGQARRSGRARVAPLCCDAVVITHTRVGASAGCLTHATRVDRCSRNASGCVTRCAASCAACAAAGTVWSESSAACSGCSSVVAVAGHTREAAVVAKRSATRAIRQISGRTLTAEARSARGRRIADTAAALARGASLVDQGTGTGRVRVTANVVAIARATQAAHGGSARACSAVRNRSARHGLRHASVRAGVAPVGRTAIVIHVATARDDTEAVR